MASQTTSSPVGIWLGTRKVFDQLAISTDDQLRKPLEPSASWKLRLSIHSPQQEPELLGGNIP